MSAKTDRDQMTVAERLTELVEKSGLSLTELSIKTGIGVPELSCFCTGKRDIGPHRAKRLADFFGIENYSELWTNAPV